MLLSISALVSPTDVEMEAFQTTQSDAESGGRELAAVLYDRGTTRSARKPSIHLSHALGRDPAWPTGGERGDKIRWGMVRPQCNPAAVEREESPETELFAPSDTR